MEFGGVFGEAAAVHEEAGRAASDEVLAAPPVLYHALWHGRLAADLTRPLGEHTLVTPGPATGDGEQEQHNHTPRLRSPHCAA